LSWSLIGPGLIGRDVSCHGCNGWQPCGAQVCVDRPGTCWEAHKAHTVSPLPAHAPLTYPPQSARYDSCLWSGPRPLTTQMKGNHFTLTAALHAHTMQASPHAPRLGWRADAHRETSPAAKRPRGGGDGAQDATTAAVKAEGGGKADAAGKGDPGAGGKHAQITFKPR